MADQPQCVSLASADSVVLRVLGLCLISECDVPDLSPLAALPKLRKLHLIEADLFENVTGGDSGIEQLTQLCDLALVGGDFDDPFFTKWEALNCLIANGSLTQLQIAVEFAYVPEDIGLVIGQDKPLRALLLSCQQIHGLPFGQECQLDNLQVLALAGTNACELHVLARLPRLEALSLAGHRGRQALHIRELCFITTLR